MGHSRGRRSDVPKSPGPDTRRAVYRRSRGFCFYCGFPLRWRDMTVNHYVPKCLGGGNGVRNLVASCTICNQRKAGPRCELGHSRSVRVAAERAPKRRLAAITKLRDTECFGRRARKRCSRHFRPASRSTNRGFSCTESVPQNPQFDYFARTIPWCRSGAVVALCAQALGACR